MVVVITGVTIVMAIFSVVAVPWMLIRMPADYFKQPKPHLIERLKKGTVAEKAIVLGRNALGLVLLASGVAMLVLPGQGLLTILVGLLLMDLPYKFEMEKKLVARPKIHKAIDWLRKKAHKQPLDV